MKSKLCVLLIFIIHVTVVKSQSLINEQSKADLAISQKKMFDCFSNGDKVTFAEITGNDYLTINADGTYFNKDGALEKIGSFKGSTYKIIQQESRFYNDIAITTGRVKFYVKSILAADVFFTQTWVRREDKWLFIGWQGTMTGQPKNYPVYVTLLLSLILIGIIWFVKLKISKRKRKYTS